MVYPWQAGSNPNNPDQWICRFLRETNPRRNSGLDFGPRQPFRLIVTNIESRTENVENPRWGQHLQMKAAFGGSTIVITRRPSGATHLQVTVFASQSLLDQSRLRRFDPVSHISCGAQRIISNRKFGGARRDRTADLLTASQTLSQLSYSPTCEKRRES